MNAPRGENADYWEARGKLGYWYRDERFYTTLPISYYYERRKAIYAALERVFSSCRDGARVLDFGCGDGTYSIHFALRYPTLRFHGVDISKSFIDRASKQASERRLAIDFIHMDGPIPFRGAHFDVTIVVGVLTAVINNDVLRRIAEDIHFHTAPGGSVVVLDWTVERYWLGRLYRRLQPGPGRGTWVKRKAADYIGVFTRAGFQVTEHRLMAHPFYLLCGRYVLYALAHACFGGDFIKANGSRWFQAIGDSIMSLGRKIDPFLRSSEGYSLLAFSKPGKEC